MSATKFEALVELSPKRSTLKGIYDGVGFESQISGSKLSRTIVMSDN
jgi:hypothetical protein